MAKTLNGGTASHNTSNRNALITECAQHVKEIKEQRAELNEDMKEVRERIKEAGISKPAFDFACRQATLEPEARDEYMDSLRECWGALGLGDQLNFIDAMGNESEGAAA